MASRSSQGCEPSSGFLLPVNENWAIREYFPRIVAGSEIIVPLQTCMGLYSFILSPVIYQANYKCSTVSTPNPDMLDRSSTASEAVLQGLNDPSANGKMGVKICVRFGCLQSRLLNQTNNGNRGFASWNPNKRQVQSSAREKIRKVIASMEAKLSEYGP